MKIIFRVFMTLMMVISGVAVARSLELSRQPVEAPMKAPGLFTMILIGEANGSDAERVVIFDLEGDAYSFRPVMPDYRVKRLTGLTAPAALVEAEKFFASHCAYDGYRVKSLWLPSGQSVGLELVPDYPPALCENGNLITVGYVVGATGEIKVYTTLLLPVGDGLSFGQVFQEKQP